jgi:hypothetical protein
MPPNKRRHVRTGRPTGAPKGNANARRHGMKTAGFFARRKCGTAQETRGPRPDQRPELPVVFSCKWQQPR